MKCKKKNENYVIRFAAWKILREKCRWLSEAEFEEKNEDLCRLNEVKKA